MENNKLLGVCNRLTKNKLSKINSSDGRLCSEKKPCCTHRCCNAQSDEQCCATCEPLSNKVYWNYELGFHVID